MQLTTVIKATRPPFLVLSPVVVFLGLRISLAATPHINALHFILILVAALAAHISVNTFNEYFDFKTGLDLATQKTPFSGGSGALPEYPGAAKAVFVVAIISLFVTAMIGIYFIAELGTRILPLGLLGVVIIVTYTQWLNRLPLACLIAPGLGFGMLMVTGTEILLTGNLTESGLLVAVVTFFLMNNLLLLNQYPDIKADASVGRRTVPVVFGITKSNIVYAIFAFSACAIILYLVISGLLPALVVIALLPMALSIFALSGAIKYGAEIGKQSKYLAANVAASILTPLILGLTIMLGS